jgi:hypothetical protein
MYLELVLLTIFLMLVLMLFGMPIGFAMAFVGF